MEDRAAAIIVSKRHILLIHRIRVGREYYVFPGGHIEAGESAQEACIREVLEETGLQTAWIEPAFEFTNPPRLEYFFFVQVQPGTLSMGGPEAFKRSEQNRYLLEWIPLVQIGNYALRPAPVRDALLRVVTEEGPLREVQELAQHREQLKVLLTGPAGG
jgi:8-oxo-dGTP diphosphatase